MEIKRKENEEVGKYYLEENDQEAAKMEYRLRTGRLIIVHTVVNSGYEGKGLGIKLVEKAIADARQGNYAIVPVCRFARKYFDKHPEAHDVL